MCNFDEKFNFLSKILFYAYDTVIAVDFLACGFDSISLFLTLRMQIKQWALFYKYVCKWDHIATIQPI